MLDRQQQEKLVEEIELSKLNPEVSEEGEDQGSDNAEDVMVVSPTRAPREIMDVELQTVSEEPIVSLDDIDGFILSQPNYSECEGGTQSIETEGKITRNKPVQKLPIRRSSKLVGHSTSSSPPKSRSMRSAREILSLTLSPCKQSSIIGEKSNFYLKVDEPSTVST